MRSEVAEALRASTLTEERQRVVREHFDQQSVKALPADKFMADLTAMIEQLEAEQAAWLKSPRHLALQALEAAFFGTLRPRADSTRPARAKDGWRDRVSHPFEYDGETYDVVPVEELPPDASPHEQAVALGLAGDRTLRQYQRLRAQIIATEPAA